MKAAEIREAITKLMTDKKGPLTLECGELKFEYYLRKRTDKLHRDALDEARKLQSQAYQEFMNTPALIESARGRLKAFSKAELVEGVLKYAALEMIALGLDQLDDLIDDTERTEEELAKRRRERLEQLLAKQREDLNTKTHEEVLELLVTDKADTYARIQQGNAFRDLTVCQSVVDEDGEPVFPTLDDLRSLPEIGSAIEMLRAEVNRFLETENQRLQREVAESPDFQASTE